MNEKDVPTNDLALLIYLNLIIYNNAIRCIYGIGLTEKVSAFFIFKNPSLNLIQKVLLLSINCIFIFLVPKTLVSYFR